MNREVGIKWVEERFWSFVMATGQSIMTNNSNLNPVWCQTSCGWRYDFTGICDASLCHICGKQPHSHHKELHMKPGWEAAVNHWDKDINHSDTGGPLKNLLMLKLSLTYSSHKWITSTCKWGFSHSHHYDIIYLTCIWHASKMIHIQTQVVFQRSISMMKIKKYLHLVRSVSTKKWHSDASMVLHNVTKVWDNGSDQYQIWSILRQGWLKNDVSLSNICISSISSKICTFMIVEVIHFKMARV